MYGLYTTQVSFSKNDDYVKSPTFSFSIFRLFIVSLSLFLDLYASHYNLEILNQQNEKKRG